MLIDYQLIVIYLATGVIRLLDPASMIVVFLNVYWEYKRMLI